MTENSVRVFALAERANGENRVSVTPQSVTRLIHAGAEVAIEPGAGRLAWIDDADFVASGARMSTLATGLAEASVVTCVQSPSDEVLSRMHPGQFVIGLLSTRTDATLVETLRTKSLIGLDLSLLPRTMSNAQSMDAMTSQDSVAGYKAALLAADTFGGYFPMMITAAGTSRPARILVLGAGIAGLQAMATARRLGAEVAGFDVRPECRPEMESLGATFLELTPSVTSVGSDGYARALTDDEMIEQQKQLQGALHAFDVVITTARVPGRRPPVLVTAAATRTMRAGSVVIDMAASDLGGNVAGSTPERSLIVGNGVTVIGAGQLASHMPSAASAAYARNVADVIAHVVRAGRLRLDPSDPIDAALTVCDVRAEQSPSALPHQAVSL